MHKLTAFIGSALLSAAAFAQDGSADAARQQRMDAAYDAHHESTAARVADTTKRDARAAGHAIHQGVRATGHAIHQGLRATGHAIHQGVRATGHAVHHGVDKVTGHP